MSLKTFGIRKYSDYSEILAYCRSGDCLSGDKVVFDFTGKTFLTTFDILMLAQTAIYLKSERAKDGEYSVYVNAGDDAIRKYISDIGLVDFCKTNHIQPNTIDAIESQSAMPIRRIERGYLEEYILRTKGFIDQFAKDKDLTFLKIGIDESINNAHDHSSSPIGTYVFCQYYKKNNRISVCVTDMGEGIPVKVREYLGDSNMTDMECLVWATKSRNSTKSTPANAGLGLANIIDFVKTNNSWIRIRSNDGTFTVYNNEEKVKPNAIKNFKGTSIEFEIIIDNLPLKEDDYLDDDRAYF